jgi:TetR/AcrR family transcriptional repressor of bet genes
VESIGKIRRTEIIQAFFKIISEKGLAKATIREIADTAGFNHGLLHHYFSDKGAIIAASVEYAVNVYREELLEGLEGFDSSAEQLKFLIPRYLDIGRLNLQISQAWLDLYALSKTEDSIKKPVQECFREARDLIREIIARGIKKGEFRKVNPRVMASAILGSLEGVTMLWVIDPEGTPVVEVGKQIEDLIGAYLKKKQG